MAKLEIEVSDAELQKLKCKNPNAGPIKIAILQRGWIFIGRFSKKGSDCVLENSSCIRQWGTTKGLGELINGPTSKTVLDEASTVRFHELGLVALIDVNQEGWAKKC